MREIYRSSGWPCRDPLEVDLIVAALVQAERDEQGRETLHLTPTGLQALADAHVSNQGSRSAHDELVSLVAQRMQLEGRIAWTQLALRAQVDGAWTQAIPDVFSIRNTTVEVYLEPVVHEIKVSRADLLSDLKRPEKRAAYLAMASQVYYVLGCNAKGQAIGNAEEVPAECGVIVAASSGLEIVRIAPKQRFTGLRFDVWMALSKASPLQRNDHKVQMSL